MDSFSAISGIAKEIIVKEFNYSYERQGIRKVGGIPVGLYAIRSEDQRSALTSPYSHIILAYSWGNYS